MRLSLLMLTLVSCGTSATRSTLPAIRNDQIQVTWRFDVIAGENTLAVDYGIANRSSSTIGIRAIDRHSPSPPQIGAVFFGEHGDGIILLGVSGVIYEGGAPPIRLVEIAPGVTHRGRTWVRLPNWDRTGFLKRTSEVSIYLVIPIYLRDSHGRVVHAFDWRDGPRPLRRSDFPDAIKRGLFYPAPWGIDPPNVEPGDGHP